MGKNRFVKGWDRVELLISTLVNVFVLRRMYGNQLLDLRAGVIADPFSFFGYVYRLFLLPDIVGF